MLGDSLLIFFLFLFSSCNVVYLKHLFMGLVVACRLDIAVFSNLMLLFIICILPFNFLIVIHVMCVRWSQFGVVSVA